MLLVHGPQPSHQSSHSGIRGIRVVVAVMFVLVATVLPYQFAFAATFVALIAISMRALVIAHRMASDRDADVADVVLRFSLSHLFTPTLPS